MKFLLGSLVVLALLHVACSMPYPDESDLQSIQDLVDQLQQADMEQEADYNMENGNMPALFDQLALEQGDDMANEERFGWLKKIWGKVKRVFHRRRKHKRTYNSLRRGCAIEQADDETYMGYEQDYEMGPQETVDALLNQLQQQTVQEQGRRRRKKCTNEQVELQDAYETLAQLQQMYPGLADEQSFPLLHQDMEAAIEGWWSTAKEWGRKAFNGAKKGCKYIPLENQNKAETEWLGTAYTLLKGACGLINGGSVTAEGVLGFNLSDLKKKAVQLLGKAQIACKTYRERTGIVQRYIEDGSKNVDMICSGLNGSQPAVAQLFVTNAVRAVVEDKEQADIEQSTAQDLIRSFSN